MKDVSSFNSSLEKDKRVTESLIAKSNPMLERTNSRSIALTDYSQSIPCPNYDKDINDIINVVKDVSAPPGRTDIINYNNNLIIVDYAHTPDAMENIYNLVNEIKRGNVNEQNIFYEYSRA